MLTELSLDRRLRLGLDQLGFAEPTEVQRSVIPAALNGGDLMVSAETGSGKTLCYLIPIAQAILSRDNVSTSGTIALILVPTRELARQVLKQARDVLDKTQIKVQAITGGADTRYQKSLLRKDPEIIVATPGRLLELCNQRQLELDTLQTLVLDEADRMLDMGMRDDVLAIAGRCNPGRQNLLLSATLKHAGVANIAAELLREPQHIAIGEVRQPHSAIHHQVILADSQEHKDKLLPALLSNGNYQRALVFANKRVSAARLAHMLGHQGVRCGCLHGEMSTEERKHVVEQFRSGKVAVLCASDVAARGLDVMGIDVVVNYDMPHKGDDYLHRSGRTGRAGSPGLTVSLISAAEWNLMISIQRYLKLSFEQRTLPGLKARYHGPKKQKSSGKAAGAKKKRTDKAKQKRNTSQRPRKNPGKRHKDTAEQESSNDGFAPLTRKPPSR